MLLMVLVFTSANGTVNVRMPAVLPKALLCVPGFERPVTDAGTVSSPLERNIQAEYRLNRFFYVTTELGQPRSIGTVTAPLKPDFNVNLHARWEY